MDAIFGSTGQVAWYQECARATLIFLYGLLIVRLAGRRIFGKWAALDIIVSIVIGSNLSRALTGSAPLWGTLAASTLLVALHWLLAHLACRSMWLSRLLEGAAVPLARTGVLLDPMLRRYAVSQADINEGLRQSGVAELSETKKVTLEPSGRITVLKP